MSCNKCSGSNIETNLGCGCQDTTPCPQPVNNCGCQPSVVPYYAQAPCCAEDNKQTVYIQKISQVFKTTASFAMPGCGQRIWVGFDGISDVATGALLWAYGYGYLKIVSFNATTQQIELENTCPDDACGIQAAPGTPIPQCTSFIVTPPPCSSGGAGGSPSVYPYLNAGFTAPANGNCIDITVTNVNGLSVGKLITINGGIYRISAIKTATIITICNDGAGLTPGVVVDPEDGAGNLIVPVVMIDSNPCLSAGVPAGKILVCHNNITQPLEGLVNGQVPVLDAGTGEVNFRTLGLPVLDCTTLTVGLTLDPLLPPGTAYLVTVADNTLYSVADIVTIGGTAFVVTSVNVDTVHMYITPIAVVGAIQNYTVGSTLCSADCCTQLQNQLSDMSQLIADITADIAVSPTNLGAVGQSVNSNIAQFTFTNPSATKTMFVKYTFSEFILYLITGGADTTALVGTGMNIAVDANPLAVVSNLDACQDAQKMVAGINNYHSKNIAHSGATSVAPGASVTIKCQASVSWVAGTATNIAVAVARAHVAALAVAFA